MSDKKRNNITHIDTKRVNRLEHKGHYLSLLEEFDVLRTKLLYGYDIDRKEAHRLVTLIKYFLKNGHSEAFKLQVKYVYDKYIKEFNL